MRSHSGLVVREMLLPISRGEINSLVLPRLPCFISWELMMKKLAYAAASATFKLFFGLSFEEMEALQSHKTKCLHELGHFQALLTQELLDAGFVIKIEVRSQKSEFSMNWSPTGR